jgi:tRNA (guanine37-N1)-methyltransferase
MKSLSFVAKSFLASSKYSTKMSLAPPRLPGLTTLDREKFTKIVKIPTVTFQERHSKNMTDIVKNLKKFLIKVDKFHPVSNGKIYMNPETVHGWEDLPTETLEQLDIDSSTFTIEDIEFTYQNWRADELVKAITPEGLEPATSYSKVGHVLHMNLKDNLLPYKSTIAQIFKDKTPGCRTVVNKAQSIDNTFRNFQIDLLVGDADYQVQVKENGVIFEFDFSTVYWNSRLSTEHERLVKLLNSNDVLYDVFAGVGPFAVPAGKKRVNVLANDLNPHSYKWLQHNVSKNKVSSYVETFNKDGRDFILENVRDNLLERIEKRDQDMKEYSIHISMNLPALAVTFLNAFVGLLKNNGKGIENSVSIPTPICHCYCFVKGVDDRKVMAQNLVEENVGFKLVKGETLKDIHFVRNVAPNKDMMRVDLFLTSSVLFDTLNSKRSPDEALDMTPNKKQCN